MSKVKLSKIFKNVQSTLAKHSPEILIGMGVAGMISTTAMAVKATPKAMKLIEESEENTGPLNKKEVVKTVWKCYVPAALTGSLSVACIVGGTSANLRNKAALATACKLSETALIDYQEKVIDTIGEKKEQIIRDKVAKKHIDEHPVSNSPIIITEKGNTLCYDVLSGRYFKSDIETIRRIENELNRQIISQDYISLNEFYYELGIDRIKLGDELGWNTNDGMISFNFSSQLASDGTPCLVVDYLVAPRYNYAKLM